LFGVVNDFRNPPAGRGSSSIPQQDRHCSAKPEPPWTQSEAARAAQRRIIRNALAGPPVPLKPSFV
jgi:hypothetical protein